jgi:LysR family transcriptional regulator, benzoate and cis,cis-muconate-responsive activator of ben and cat genes
MELRHLRYFKAVAELLNFSRAAERLRVAQPALSRQIRSLEDELGVKLFVREPAGAQLTDAGRVFYTHTCKILAQVDLAAGAAQEAARGRGGELIICNEWRVAGQFVPAAVAEFRRRVPRAEVILHDLRFHDQLAALRGRRVHVGFLVRNILGRATDLESMLVLRARLMVVLPAGHPRAGDSMVRLIDLADESWALLDEKEAPGYHTFLTQICRVAGFTPRVGPIASTPEGLIGRAAAAGAVALTLESHAPHHNHLVRVLPLDVLPLELCAVWHRLEKSPLLQRFLDVVREHAAATLGESETAPAVKEKRRRPA